MGGESILARLLILMLALLLLVSFSGCGITANTSYTSSEEYSQVFAEASDIADEGSYEAVNYDYMKAVWLSQYDMADVYRYNGAQRAEVSFTHLAKTIMANIKGDGYNTVIIQVRPFGDSFYPSELYPVSSFVSGAYGKEDIYDPFAILIELAHDVGLSVHAWINPLRLMKTDEIGSVPAKYKIAEWYSSAKTNGKYIVPVNGRLYLNPAYEEVRGLIVDGAAEIVEKYDVDGIHMDDYFYPTSDTSFDRAAFISYKGTLAIDDYRRDNVNRLVALIYERIKEISGDVVFGISPAGNINMTYASLYADVYKWCANEGYIDYICPQLYFGLEHQTHAFDKDYKIWESIVTCESVKLCVGMTLGKAKQGYDNYAGTGKYEWSESDDIIKRCLEYLGENDRCTGVAVFCYQYMYDPVTSAPEALTQSERDNMCPALDALK